MTGRQDVFQQAMNQGHSAAWDQLWDKAVVFYRQALEEFPQHPQALINLGLALFELQEYEEALRYYQQAAEVSPDDPLPLEKIAQLFERMGNLNQASQASSRSAELYLKNRDVNKALENWERVTRLDPENLLAYSRLALIYERTGEKQKAVKAYLVVASLLQHAGSRDKAVRAVNQALTLIPDDEEATHALTLLKDFKSLPKPERPPGSTAPLRMSQVRQLEKPKEATQPDMGMDPVALACQKALTVMAGMLFEGADETQRQGDRPGLQDIVEGTTGPLRRPVDRTRIVLHLSQVVDLQTQGDFTRAAEELERAVDAGFDHPAANFDLGFLYVQSGRLESATRNLQYSLQYSAFALGARLLLGELLRNKGRLQEASIEYLEALKLADAQVVPAEQAADLLQLYEPLIEAQRQQTDSEIQERLCDNVKELLMQADWRAQLIHAREQLPKRDAESHPLPLAEMITETSSSEVVDSISSIYELAQKNRLRSAMEESFYALELAPTYLPLHTYMGEMLIKQGVLEAAVAKFKVVARTYSMRGELNQAVRLYRRVIEIAPMDLNARGRLIEQLKASDQQEDAIKEYLALAEMYYNLADLDMARKTYTEALRLAQQTKVDSSWQIKILHFMADIDLQSLNWRQALRIYEQIRTLQPDDQKSRSNLIGLNFRLGMEETAITELDNYLTYLSDSNQTGKAVAFLENMLDDDPDRVPVRRRLADLYQLLDRKEDAVSQMDAIGEIFLQVGDRVSAIQTIEMILALDPPNRASYERLLVQIRGE